MDLKKLFFAGRDGWRIKVFVRTRSSKEGFEVDEEGLVFYTSEPPIAGRANAALIKALSRALGVPASRIEIVYGLRDKSKVVEIKEKDVDALAERLSRALGLES